MGRKYFSMAKNKKRELQEKLLIAMVTSTISDYDINNQALTRLMLKLMETKEESLQQDEYEMASCIQDIIDNITNEK